MRMRQYLCLNAPFGARCFLTLAAVIYEARRTGLYAPFGARCFLTPAEPSLDRRPDRAVLMHLLALGAF